MYLHQSESDRETDGMQKVFSWKQTVDTEVHGYHLIPVPLGCPWTDLAKVGNG